MDHQTALTGATGALGSLIAERVRDLDPVVLVRDPSRAPGWATAVRVCEYADRRHVHRAFVGAAARSGVRHVVYTSFAGASPTATFTYARDHAAPRRRSGSRGWRSRSSATASTPTSCRSSAVVGRPIRFEDEPVEKAYASRAEYDAEPREVDGWVSTYTAVADGSMAEVSNDVERVLGRPALSLEQALTG